MENVRPLEIFTLPSIRNHVDQVVEERAPWGSLSVPDPTIGKVAFLKWLGEASTEHLCYSPYEGLANTLRIGADNPAEYLRAIVVDYECHRHADTQLEATLQNTDPKLLPTFVSRSYRRGVHAIWVLEEPLWCGSDDYRGKLLSWFKRKLKLDRFLPGMDLGCYEKKTNVFYAAGTDWQEAGGIVIPSTVLSKAAYDCMSSASFSRGFPAVPLEIVAKKVEEKYPGVWKGDFVEGARGTRFWDPDGDATGTIIHPEGAISHTGDRKFHSWGMLFGRSFVEDFEENRIGEAAKCAWFDGREFWTYSDKLRLWMQISEKNLSRKLRVEHGLSGTTSAKVAASEVDKALHVITTTQIVHSASPFVQRWPGPIWVEGKQHLNIASVEPCKALGGVADETQWSWLANFFSNCFTKSAGGNDEDEQLWRFFAWLQRVYLASVNYSPCQGHVLVVAGNAGCGKTLLANTIVGMTLGGQKDASKFLLGEGNFNKGLFDAPLWVVNDAVAASDPGRKAKYNSLVKRVAANREFEREVKFLDATDVSWMGRLIITCNTDPESLGMMPQVDASMEDKIIALHAWGGEEGVPKEEVAKAKGFGVTDGKHPDDHIRKELPAFLSWLMAWEPPAWITRDSRFGYESYYDPTLKQMAESVGYASNFAEILGVFFRNFFDLDAHKKLVEWEGTSTELHHLMLQDGYKVEGSMKNYSPQLMGKQLSNLVSRGKITKRLLDGYSNYTFTREGWGLKSK